MGQVLVFPHKKVFKIIFFINRVIVHPNFKNIDFKRAERILDNREKDRSDVGEVEYSQGDVIIRPSSKGNLTIFFYGQNHQKISLSDVISRIFCIQISADLHQYPFAGIACVLYVLMIFDLPAS